MEVEPVKVVGMAGSEAVDVASGDIGDGGTELNDDRGGITISIDG